MTQSIVALELIKRSMYLINALAAGETPDSDSANDALITLNEMIDSWSLQKLAVYGEANSEFVLTPAQSLYTWGTGGDFNVQRPVFVDEAYCIRSGVTTPVRIVGVQEWNAIALKSLASPLPEQVYLVNGYPNFEVNVWPVPTEAVTLGFSDIRVMDSVATLQTIISLPPGYLKALRYNLAVELWPEYNNSTTDIARVGNMAAKSLGLIKVANMTDVLSSYSDIPDLETARSWDWRLG